MWRRGKLAFSLSLIQFVIIVVFTLRSYYGKEADASDGSHSYAPISTLFDTSNNSIASNYHAFDEFLKFLLLVMGASMTLAADYTLSGIGLTLLTTSIAFQSSLASRLLFHDRRIIVDIKTMIKSCYAVLSVSLSSRSVQGRLSPLQLAFFTVCSTLCYEINLFTTEKFTVHELFPSIRVLMFGSFFGVGASMVMNKELCLQCRRLVSVNNQLVILYSVTMCFCLWPTVLAGFSVGDKRHRIIVNAILSQTSAVVTSFAAASLINSDNLFVVKVVQIGSAGGCVAISAVVGFMLYPAGALLIGAAGSAVAISSFLLVTPCLMRNLRAPDYFDVVSSYCMPSLFSALLSVIFSWLASEDDYGLTMYEIFPARSPKSNSSELEEMIDLLPRIKAGEGRTAGDQTLFQLVTILITLIFSLSSGIIIGLCTRFKFFDPLQSGHELNDDNNWHIMQVVVLGNESNKGDNDCGVESAETSEASGLRDKKMRSII